MILGIVQLTSKPTGCIRWALYAIAGIVNLTGLPYAINQKAKPFYPVIATRSRPTNTNTILANETEQTLNPDLVGFVGQFDAYEGGVCNFIEWMGGNGVTNLFGEDGKAVINTTEANYAMEFLKGLIAYLAAAGYERLTTSHHPNNRAIMIAELKAGFHITGLELHEGYGPLVKMAYLFHQDRRESFEHVFSMAPDPTRQI